ncbi:MAG: DUF2062 domain-containing protein [Pseudomonadota bacterium]
MIFKRREKPSVHTRLREVLFPRKGVWRGLGYLGKRIRRLPDSPHRIALGFACGGLASFTPLFGFHFFVAAALAWMLRGNILASAFGTAVGNPLTFPLIATASLHTGWWVLGTEDRIEADFSFGWLSDNIDQIFFPYAIGGVLPGLATGLICYVTIGPAVAAYQERRRNKLAMRAARLQEAISREQDAYALHDAREGDNA